MFILGYAKTAQKTSCEVLSNVRPHSSQNMKHHFVVDLQSHPGPTTRLPKDTATSLVWSSGSLSINPTSGHAALDPLRQDSGTPFSSVSPTSNLAVCACPNLAGLDKNVTLILSSIISNPQHIPNVQSSL